jgi:hypothetical protein
MDVALRGVEAWICATLHGRGVFAAEHFRRAGAGAAAALSLRGSSALSPYVTTVLVGVAAALSRSALREVVVSLKRSGDGGGGGLHGPEEAWVDEEHTLSCAALAPWCGNAGRGGDASDAVLWDALARFASEAECSCAALAPVAVAEWRIDVVLAAEVPRGEQPPPSSGAAWARVADLHPAGGGAGLTPATATGPTASESPQPTAAALPAQMATTATLAAMLSVPGVTLSATRTCFAHR